MRIKIIGDNDCARATRNLLRQAGFAVTEFLPADALVNGPHAGYVITIDSALFPESGTTTDLSAGLPHDGPAMHKSARLPHELASDNDLAPAHTPDTASVHPTAGGPTSTPDPATHQLAATPTGEASAVAKAAAGASSPAFPQAAAGRPASVAAHNLIHFDSVDSALEAAILRHVTQLSTLPVIVDRPGGRVRSERELRIVVPLTDDSIHEFVGAQFTENAHRERHVAQQHEHGDEPRIDDAAAVAVEFGILRGLLDLTSPASAASEKSLLDPNGAGGQGRRKWWYIVPAIFFAAFTATLALGGHLSAAPGDGTGSNVVIPSEARNLSEVSRTERKSRRDSSSGETGLGMTRVKVVSRERGYSPAAPLLGGYLRAVPGGRDNNNAVILRSPPAGRAGGATRNLSGVSRAEGKPRRDSSAGRTGLGMTRVKVVARFGKRSRANVTVARRPAAAQGQFPYSSTGTVTHTAGALTSGHVVIGNGGADVVIDSGCSTDGAGNMTCVTFHVPVTSSSTNGVFYEGTNTFMHTYHDPSSPDYSVFVGQGAGNFTMSDGSAYQALVCVGLLSCSSMTTGQNNTAVGADSSANFTTGSFNASLGTDSNKSNVTGSNNTAVGAESLYHNIASGNTAVGTYALETNTSGASNVAVGYLALFSNVTNGSNVAIGDGALEFSTQDQLTAIGNNALNANTTGSYDTAVGAGVEAYGTTASYNTGIGNSSLGGSSLTGSYNTGIGPLTLLSNTSGNENVAISLEALYANTTGSGNTAIGYAAGYTATTANANTTGSDNTWVGTQAGPGTSTQLTNSLALGYQALNTASNQSVVGNSSTTSFIPYGTVSVNSAKPSASAGTITGTDNGGYISGLSTATAVTITFANGWSTWASCTANSSAAATQPYVSAISKTAVTFTFASLTGTVYYHCDGQ